MNRIEKTLLQGLAIVALFFATYFVTMQFDWMKIFKVEKITSQTEKKLGKLYFDIFKNQHTINKDSFVNKCVDSMVNKICIDNNIDAKTLKVYVLNSSDINAFAMPDRQLVIFSNLIKSADKQEELIGVISHEIAHIELNHVMNKLVKEVGLSVVLSMTSGGAGSETIRQSAKVLSSTAFDRKIEKQADIQAVKYMQKANINPAPFADFLFKMSLEKESDASKYLTWLSTHPDSKDRSTYILEQAKKTDTQYKPVISNTSWEELKRKMEIEKVDDEE